MRMMITVLSGSPKGEDSITLQYVKYLEQQFPAVEFRIFHVGQRIRKIAGDGEELAEILASVGKSRGVLWIFPVYFLLVPSQLKEFIELLFARNAGSVFEGKYSALLMTSIHFYDTTACDYMRGISQDLGLRLAGEYMADMYDLIRSRQRKNIRAFFQQFLAAIDRGLPTERHFPPLKAPALNYQPEPGREPEKKGNRKVLLLTDEQDPDSNLARMVQTFARALPLELTIINIAGIDLKGGCLGCLRCGYDNRCVYQDDLAGLYEEHIFPADALVIAGTMRDRYLSARWKLFFDRSFFRGHTPIFYKKQMAFIISGPLTQAGVLRNILEALVQFNRANLVGMVTDEYETSGEVTGLLHALAERLDLALELGQERPAAFYGVSAHLIFRDFVYRARGVFRADYQYYRERRLFDFPNRNLKAQLRSLNLLALQKFPALRRQVQSRLVKELLKPFQASLHLKKEE
jgi:multimeric flavodoxin WrbA